MEQGFNPFITHQAQRKPTESRNPAEINKQEAQEFIQKYKELFYSIVQDRSLDFQVGDGFMINLEEGIVYLDYKDFKLMKEKGETKWQILWSVCHELSHFLDLRSNPKEMLGNFEYLEKRSKELSPQLEAIWAEKAGGVLPEYLQKEIPIGKSGRTMKYSEYFLYRLLHRHVYNALDDIFVNRRLESRVSIFRSNGAEGKEVSRLYRDFLFPTDPKKIGVPPEDERAADCTSQPKAYQLNDSILRRAMVPDQNVLIDAEVADAHRSFSGTAQKSLGIDFEREILEIITNPANAEAMNPGWRYAQIRHLVEPAFLNFLWEDIKNQPLPDPPPPPQPGEGEGEGEGEGAPSPGSAGKNKPGKGIPGTGDPWNIHNPDGSEPIDLDTIKDYIKQKQEKEARDKKKQKEAQKSAEQKQKEAEQKQDAEICQKNGIDQANAREYRRIEKRIKGYKSELAQVFEQVMNNIEISIKNEIYEGFKSGKLNIDRLINKYGIDLASGDLRSLPWNELDVFDQKIAGYRFALYPNRIRVRLVLDGSGSMDPDKIQAVKEVSVLFLEALNSFQDTVNLRFRLQKPFVVDTEIHMFGSDSEVVKHFSSDKDSIESEQAERFNAFGKINNNWGKTNDAIPLAVIDQEIDESQSALLLEGRTMEFVFEITDGGTRTIDASQKLIESLTNKGAIARGLQIGKPDPRDVAIFSQVWGDKGEKVKQLEELAPAVAKMLAGKIQEMQFKVQLYSFDED